LLDATGVRERVESAGFLRPDRAVVRWAEATDRHKSQPGELGFQVDRGVFDALLLDAAREAEVRIIQPALALPSRREPAGGWQLPVRCNGATFDIRAQFLADATGRRSLAPGPSARTSAPTLALYAYWRRASIGGPETRIEAGEDHWFWGAPMPDRTFNATVFLDPKKCANAGRTGLEARYRSLLAGSSLLRGCLNGVMIGPVTACDATCRAAINPIDERSIKVGEAAFSIDPLSSQGVQAAMASALHGAHAVHTLLAVPLNAAAALTFYRARQAEAVERHRAWAAQCYTELIHFQAHDFWAKRGALALPSPPHLRLPQSIEALPAGHCRIAISADARLVDATALVGDVITEVPTLEHPTLDRPVAFLENHPVAPLLAALGEGATVESLLERWSRTIPQPVCLRLFHWMWAHEIVVAVR
jgi:flavin-dependent dehydrogenase